MYQPSTWISLSSERTSFRLSSVAVFSVLSDKFIKLCGLMFSLLVSSKNPLIIEAAMSQLTPLAIILLAVVLSFVAMFSSLLINISSFLFGCHKSSFLSCNLFVNYSSFTCLCIILKNLVTFMFSLIFREAYS